MDGDVFKLHYHHRGPFDQSQNIRIDIFLLLYCCSFCTWSWGLAGDSTTKCPEHDTRNHSCPLKLVEGVIVGAEDGAEVRVSDLSRQRLPPIFDAFKQHSVSPLEQ